MSSRVKCQSCGARVPPAEKCVRCRASLHDNGPDATWIIILVAICIVLPTLAVAGIGIGIWMVKGPKADDFGPRHAANKLNENVLENDDDDDDDDDEPADPMFVKPRHAAKPVDLKIPPPPPRLPIAPTTLTRRTTYKLPETADGMVPAGGGRYFILHFPKLRKVGVFDVNETKIVHYIDLDEERPQLAASMTKLVVYQPTSKQFQRYDLRTGQREAIKDFPGVDVKAIAIGHSSSGPIAVAASDGGRLVHLDSLDEIALPIGPRQLPFRDRLWAVANGHAFIGTGGLVTLDRDLKVLNQHTDALHYARPSPDGKYVFRDGCGAVSAENLKTTDAFFSDPSRGSQFGYYCLPATHGPYYFHIHFGHQPLGILPKEHEGFSRSITVYMYGLDRKIIETNVDDIPDWGNLHEQSLPFDDRLHLIPQANLFVSMSPTRDQLTLIPLDLETALDKIASEAVLVTSIPPATFSPGHEFRYAIHARSKEGKLKYLIESGPSDMKVDAKGVVTWKVPANFANEEASVIISIRDIAGKEAFHSFKLVKSNLPEQSE